jgi:hypothetical protein
MTYHRWRRFNVSEKQVTRPHFPIDDPRDRSAIARRITLFDKRLRRRSLLGGAIGFASVMAVGGRDLRHGPATVAAAAQDAALPDDAAPPDQQVLVMPANVQTDKTPDFYESVY